jgi:hypothetical protein
MSKIITLYSFPSQECIINLISSWSERVIIVAYEYFLDIPRRNTSNLFEYVIACCFCFKGTNCFAIDISNLFEYSITCCFRFEGTIDRFTVDANLLKYISLVSIL